MGFKIMMCGTWAIPARSLATLLVALGMPSGPALSALSPGCARPRAVPGLPWAPVLCFASAPLSLDHLPPPSVPTGGTSAPASPLLCRRV